MDVDEKPTRLDPISDFLIVEVHEVPPEQQIILPPGVTRDDQPDVATVLAAGPGLVLADGTHAPMPCAPGDLVLLQFGAGTRVRLGGRQVRMVPARDLFGVLR